METLQRPLAPEATETTEASEPSSSNAGRYVATFGERVEEVAQFAHQVAMRPGVDWITYFREVLGVEGIVRRLFPQAKEQRSFEKLAEYDAIINTLGKLRADVNSQDIVDPERVITLRIPKSLHTSLRADAHAHKTSMNQLCISRLLRLADPNPQSS